MHYIKDIVQNQITEHAHNKFVRYSRGVFTGPLAKIKFTANNVRMSASFHFSDELLMMVADYMGDREVHVKGSLVWNKDLSADLARLGIKYSKVTKSRGIFKYVLDNEVRLKEFVDEMINYNLLLTIKEEDLSLVMKPSFPKPNKEITSDFCKAVFPGSFAKKIKAEFAFDMKEEKVKDIEIKHEIVINDLEIPDINNFEEARRLAKRMGTLKRSIAVNGEDPVISDFNIKV